MALDKWIAAIFLLISIVYGYAAFTYHLLPFERNMSFLPNTMPMVLSVFGAFFAIIILLTPAPKEGGESGTSITLAQWREYKIGQGLGLIAAMIVYALAIRPIGFVGATTLFLVGTGWILGERKLPKMIGIALVGALTVWYLVQETLGIFLKPWPWFVG